MPLGIRNMQFKGANQAVASNTPIAVAGLVVPIGRNSTIHCRYHLNFDDASVSGLIVFINGPAGSVIEGDGNAWIYDGIGNLDAFTLQPGQGNPLQGPGFTFLGGGFGQFGIGDVNALITNGNTAGNISLMFQQSVTTPGNPVTIFRWAYVDWTVLR